MKPFEELSNLGRVRRMRQVAQAALNAYELPDVHFTLLRQAGNTLFKVNEGNPVPAKMNELDRPGQYMLRIHQPGYQSSEAIELELAWLRAMRQEANLPVPEPVATPDGSLLTQTSIPGVPGERNCSLLRWLQGRPVTKSIRPDHYRRRDG